MFRLCIGLAMRVYRASPLYPRLGRMLAKTLSWVAPKKAVVASVNGFQFELDLREVIDSSLYYSGTFEPHAEYIMATVVPAGGVAIDVGANIGYHTFALGRTVGPTGQVLAIEPTTAAYDRLCSNLALNPSLKNVRTIRVGLSDTDIGEVEAEFQSSFRLDGRLELRKELVRLVTLDTLVEELGLTKVDFIKIDVDGYEAKVFAGARRTISCFRPIIFFEFGPRLIRENGDEPDRILDFLAESGYQLETETRKPTHDHEAVHRSVLPGVGIINLLAIPESSSRRCVPFRPQTTPSEVIRLGSLTSVA